MTDVTDAAAPTQLDSESGTPINTASIDTTSTDTASIPSGHPSVTDREHGPSLAGTAPLTGPVADRPPVFILGMLQRTGTNHLWDLFGLHPDVYKLNPVFEDQLVRWSGHLFDYVDDVTRCWSPEWEVPTSERSSLLQSIGGGIASWIASHDERRVVTKMPSVEQAERFFELFPDCPLVVLVRDGRNVSESGVKSFGWSYERAFDRWRRAADVVLDLQRQHADNPRFAVVRYEDVVDDPVGVMRQLCDVAALDPERYPFAEIEKVPVRGSSTLRSEHGSDLHWTPVERTTDFDPRSRFKSWDDHLHRRFEAVAGSQQRALGYDLVETTGDESINDRVDTAKQLAELRVRRLRVHAGRARRAVLRVRRSI